MFRILHFYQIELVNFLFLSIQKLLKKLKKQQKDYFLSYLKLQLYLKQGIKHHNCNFYILGRFIFVNLN